MLLGEKKGQRKDNPIPVRLFVVRKRLLLYQPLQMLKREFPLFECWEMCMP